MFSSLLLVVCGLLLLIAGGEVLLRGAVGLATFFRLTPAVIGLTVVAAGTSVPELSVSALAAFHGKSDIAVGNVVGSNIFNIGFILGAVALYRPLTLIGNTIRLEYPFLAVITVCFLVFSGDLLVGRSDAIVFIGLYIAFTYYLVNSVRKKFNVIDETHFDSEISDLTPKGNIQHPLGLPTVLTVAGIILLGFGAELTVDGAVKIGEIFGMSERLIGLTIVGAGTGLPELVTSLVSAYRGRNDVAIANVIGSNIFNILGILGLTALVAPIPIAPEIISSDAWWMLGLTAMMLPVMKSGLVINRWEGLVLLLVYLIYLLQLIF